MAAEGGASQLLLTGEIIDAREALRIGLVDEVVPVAELMTRAEAIGRSIAAKAPLAIAETLRAVEDSQALPLDLGLLREAETFGRLCATADKAEATSAFLEKRAAGPWKGE